MSPEVRFTRTPERVLKERRMQAAPHSTTEGTERQARDIAATRVPDPAPAVQERLQALQNKAASQEADSGAARAFSRVAPPTQHPVKRPAPAAPRAEMPAPRTEALQRRAPSAPVAPAAPVAAAPVEPLASPAKSDPVSFELSAVRSYSFMWQPGTYLLDPSLPTPSVPPTPPAAAATAKREEKVPVVKKAAPVVESRRRMPEPPPPAAEPEDPPWDDEEEDTLEVEEVETDVEEFLDEEDGIVEEAPRRAAIVTPPRPGQAPAVPVPANDSFRRDNYASVSVGVSAPVGASFAFELPELDLLAEPKIWDSAEVPVEVLQENAATLENVLWDFNVKGEIINVRPGPVVTLYELEPAPGTKSSRVISLA
ncbi:DNA translocase FtsK, partial [Microvirga zambiensis]|uniref:DNA translocase FtsK n=1 Tax=Microvirga zambiensis TaxID=1402137 RepID=UPI0024835C54